MSFRGEKRGMDISPPVAGPHWHQRSGLSSPRVLSTRACDLITILLCQECQVALTIRVYAIGELELSDSPYDLGRASTTRETQKQNLEPTPQFHENSSSYKVICKQSTSQDLSGSDTISGRESAHAAQGHGRVCCTRRLWRWLKLDHHPARPMAGLSNRQLSCVSMVGWQLLQ